MLRIGFLGICSPTYYACEYGIYQKSLDALQCLYGTRVAFISAPVVESVEATIPLLHGWQKERLDFLLVQNSGFSMGDIALKLGEYGMPFYVWAVEEPTEEGDIKLHSLVSLNLFASNINRFHKGFGFRNWFYGNVENPLFQRKFEKELEYLEGARSLGTPLVGIIGDPAPTFDNLAIDEESLSHLGIAVRRFTEKDLVSYIEGATESEASRYLELIKRSAGTIRCSDDSIVNTSKVAAGLSRMVKTEGLASLAAPCWPFFQDSYSLMPCVAYSCVSSDTGIPISCEGDAGGAVSMMVARELTGMIPTIMDFTRITPDGEGFLLWHCGIGSMELFPGNADVSIIHHPMMNRKDALGLRYGCCYSCSFSPGDITVMRLSFDGKSMFFLSGTIGSNIGEGYLGTRGYVVNIMQGNRTYTALDVLQTILDSGLEHHLVLLKGHWEHELTRFCKQNGIRIMEMKRYEE